MSKKTVKRLKAMEYTAAVMVALVTLFAGLRLLGDYSSENMLLFIAGISFDFLVLLVVTWIERRLDAA